jgi:arabinofuranosyltransferase
MGRPVGLTGRDWGIVMNRVVDANGLTGKTHPGQHRRRIREIMSRLDARAIAGAGVIGFFAQLYHQRYFFHDDAYISLRFARNLLDHGVLDWNLGERVEGYTNFLHIIATVLVMALGAEPVLAVRIVNALAVAALAAICWTALTRVLPGPAFARERAIGLALVLLAAPLPLWLLGGLETVMTTALVTAAVALVLSFTPDGDSQARTPGVSSLLAAGILFGAAVLTRPDAAAIAAAAMLGILIFHTGSFQSRVRSVAVIAAPAALIVLAHLAWRYSYYGDVVPNTFYAKVGIPVLPRLMNGVSYLPRLVLELPALLLALNLARLALDRGRMTAQIGILSVVLVVHLASIVWAGGDHMPGARMFLPCIGLAGLVTALTIAAQPVDLRPDFTFAAVAVALFGFLAFGQQKMDPAAYVGRAVGLHLDQTERPGSLVALSTAGSVPFHAPNLRYIDMLGLVDRTIARRTNVPMLLPWQYTPGHAKGDGAYVLARKPDLIILGPAAGTLAVDPWFLSDIEIATNAEFRRCYRFESSRFAYPQDTKDAAPTTVELKNVLLLYRRFCVD